MIEPPVPPPAFGGSKQSSIIDPDEFYELSQRAAVAAAQALRIPDQPALAHDAAVDAVTALEEVLKFIPAGSDSVAPQSFGSARGRAMRAAHPDRFRKEQLESMLRFYRETLVAPARRLSAD